MLGVDGINKLQEENKRLNEIIDSYQPRIEELKELKAENELLREENLEEQKQYTEVVSANAQKIRRLKQTLQEINAIAEQCINKDACFECEYSDDCYIEDAEIPTYDICKLLIQKITKTEEE